MSTRADFLSALASLRSSSTFLAIHGYRNAASELADYNVIFHMSYENALRKSLSIMQSLSLFQSSLERQARDELVTSFETSLLTPEADSVLADPHYQHFYNDDGSVVKGVKLHLSSNTLHLYGLIRDKRVREEGIYPKKNQRPLTVAKDKLRRLTPVGAFRQWKILPEQCERIAVGKLSLLPPSPWSL